MKVRLLGGVEGRSSNVSPEKCINLFYEKGENGESLVNVHGATEFADCGDGEVRGGIAYNNLAYFVCGATLYEVDSAGTATSKGTLNTSTGLVSMAHNGTRVGAKQQICIADGTDVWIYDNTTSTMAAAATSISLIQASISAVTTGSLTTTFTTSGAHGLATGWTVKIENIVDDGPDGDMETMFNDNSYEITVADTTNFSVAINSSALTNAWASGGTASREAVAIKSESVVFIDGYFILAEKDTDRFWLTGLYDGATIDPLDFSTAEGDPDLIQSLIADQRQLQILGETSMSSWYNSGDSDNIFQRYQGGFKQTGCAAKFSPARIDNTIMWLSQNDRGHAQVVQLGEGYLPRVVSTSELDYELSTYSTVSDAFSYAYQFEGHEFYVINFPTERRVWAYDVSTQRWHQRAHSINGLFPDRERYNCHVFAFGKHLLGDYSNGKIYAFSSTTHTFDGTRVERVVVTPNITDEERRIRLSSLQLDMEEGTGDPNVTTDTSIWLSYSRNGGHTYSNEIDGGVGDAGAYAKRVMWRRLGWGRNWTFKIRTWTPNKVRMKALYVRPYGTDPDDPRGK